MPSNRWETTHFMGRDYDSSYFLAISFSKNLINFKFKGVSLKRNSSRSNNKSRIDLID
jgi:hypothetical protein